MKTIDKFRCLAFLLALPFIIIGYIGWFSPFLGAAFFKNEFPIGHCLGFAVDSQGRIYTGSGFYNRVQIYNSEGRYLRGWPIGTSFGKRVAPKNGANQPIYPIRMRGKASKNARQRNLSIVFIRGSLILINLIARQTEELGD